MNGLLGYYETLVSRNFSQKALAYLVARCHQLLCDISGLQECNWQVELLGGKMLVYNICNKERQNTQRYWRLSGNRHKAIGHFEGVR
jgi:hypothetical protein